MPSLKGTYLLLERNSRFFGKGKIIAGKLLGPNIDGIIFKIFASNDINFKQDVVTLIDKDDIICTALHGDVRLWGS